MRDALQFVHDSVPEELLKESDLRELVVKGAGGPVRRRLARRWLRGKSRHDIVELIARQQPRIVREQQEKVAWAEGLIFVAPVFWMGFPAILKGWLERVFAYGFAYTLTPAGWQGDLEALAPQAAEGPDREPDLLHEGGVRQGLGCEAMHTILCEWGLKMAGVQEAEHVFFYAVIAADDETRRQYLARAYSLGKEFA